MSPRTEYLFGAALAALICAGAVLLLARGGAHDLLRWLPPAPLAAVLGAWAALRWQRGRPPRPGALSRYASLVALLAYPLVLAAYAAVIMAATEQSPSAAVFLQLLLLLVVLGCLRTLGAAIPYSVFQYLLCRRYLRRTASQGHR